MSEEKGEQPVLGETTQSPIPEGWPGEVIPMPEPKKRTISDEQKKKMKAGRIAANKKRADAKAKQAAKMAGAMSVHTPAPETISGASVQVRGALLTVTAKTGKVYTVPADEAEDYQLFRSNYKLTDLPGYDPLFAYQFENTADVAPLLSNHWEIVERGELGLPALPSTIPNEYGLPLGSAYMVNGQVCLKRLKQWDERERGAYDRFAKSIANSFSPAQDSAKRKLEKEKDGLVTDKVDSKTMFKEPSGHAAT